MGCENRPGPVHTLGFLNTWFLGRPGIVDLWVRRTQKPFQKVGGEARQLLEWFLGPPRLCWCIVSVNICTGLVPSRPAGGLRKLEWSPSCHRALLCVVRPSRNSVRHSRTVIRFKTNSITTPQNFARAFGPNKVLRGSSRIVI